MKVEIKTRRFFTCPAGCAHWFEMEHLLVDATAKERNVGPWYCDNCNRSWTLTYSTAGVSVELAESRYPETVTLEIPPHPTAIRFEVRAHRYKPAIDESDERYFYEEHTCPVNWLRHVTEVTDGEDDDPHGLWKLVSVVDGHAR